MKMSIYVVNLAAYNNGELKGAWFDLPADMDDIFTEIFDEDELDENGEPLGDWAIHDYGGDISVSENADIERLNEAAAELEDVEIPDIHGTFDAADVINLASELENVGVISDSWGYVDDIVDDERLDQMVTEMISSDSGWQSVRSFLSGIEYANDDWYRIDGYGNAENLTMEHLEIIIEELVDEIKRHYGL